MIRYSFLLLLMSAISTDIAHAYLGPGLGLGAIGAVIGLFVAVFLSIVGVIWYPLKRMMRKTKASKANTGSDK